MKFPRPLRIFRIALVFGLTGWLEYHFYMETGSIPEWQKSLGMWTLALVLGTAGYDDGFTFNKVSFLPLLPAEGIIAFLVYEFVPGDAFLCGLVALLGFLTAATAVRDFSHWKLKHPLFQFL